MVDALASRPTMTISELHACYLRILGFGDASQPPSGLAGLKEIVKRHIIRVPFENVSKLLLYDRLGRGQVTSLTDFLGGIENSDLGGTCYTSNPHLVGLLDALGYDVDLLGADMAEANVHTCVRVRIETGEYHVDVGYAAPFREPMRLDELPFELPRGERRYVFDRCRGDCDRYEMKLLQGDEHVHGYIVHGPPRTAGFFDQTVVNSFEPGRQFMSCLRLTRTFEHHTVELINRRLTWFRESQHRQRKLKNMRELTSVVENELAMPRCPVEEAIDILERLNDKRFFD